MYKVWPIQSYGMLQLKGLFKVHSSNQGPVVRRPISANPGLDFNPGFFFFLSKAFSWIVFSILFRVFNHQIVDKNNETEFAF